MNPFRTPPEQPPLPVCAEGRSVPPPESAAPHLFQKLTAGDEPGNGRVVDLSHTVPVHMQGVDGALTYAQYGYDADFHATKGLRVRRVRWS